jgi:hypothetical protein
LLVEVLTVPNTLAPDSVDPPGVVLVAAAAMVTLGATQPAFGQAPAELAMRWIT